MTQRGRYLRLPAERLPVGVAFLVAFFGGLSCWAVLAFAAFMVLRMFGAV